MTTTPLLAVLEIIYYDSTAAKDLTPSLPWPELLKMRKTDAADVCLMGRLWHTNVISCSL